MAAKAKTSTINVWRAKTKKRRPGVHSKKKTSRNKRSKFYKKSYRGQGK